MRATAYSPYAIAEYTVGMLLALNREIPSAWQRVRIGNFDLNSLIGSDLHGNAVGIIDTGSIGAAMVTILQLGFGSHVLGTISIHVRPCKPSPSDTSIATGCFANSTCSASTAR